MNKPREAALLLLPCVGLLALALTLGRARPPVQAKPAAPAEQRAYISIQPPMTTAPGVISMAAGLHFGGPYLAERPDVRWYLNCRIEGLLIGKPHVFYASAGHDPYSCASPALHTSSSTQTHRVRQAFDLNRLPAGASKLVYRVAAVALRGAWAIPQEMTQGELQQARHSGRLLGAASNTMPLSPSAPLAPLQARPHRMPYILPAPKPRKVRQGLHVLDHNA